ncbi:MAG: magnesium/cobalt transporter CorA [Chloroflexota bacterium]
MIRAMYFDPKDGLRHDLQMMDIAFALHNPVGLLWVDIHNDTPQESEALLTKTFNFHPLAADDALQESHYPKIDDWGEYLYIVLHAVAIDAQDSGRVDTQELDIFLGPHYMVTHHDETIAAVEKVWAAVQRDPRHLKDGIDHVLYRLTDEVAASFMPVVESFDETIDQIEAQIFGKPGPRVLEKIFTIKRSVLYLRRIIAPQREVLNMLARDEFAVIDARDRIYFRDVYDHLVRMYDITEGVRDLVTGTLDTYLSVTSNRMNDVMKTLTIITTIFMPISFLSGFFGMNIFLALSPVDPWTSALGKLLTFALFIIAPIVMIQWMRSRGWLQKNDNQEEL